MLFYVIFLFINRESLEETLSTIRFAERAKHITTLIKANSYNASDSKIIKKLMKEVKYLKDILNMRRGG